MTKDDLENYWMREILVRQLVVDDLPALEWNGQFTHFRRMYREIYQSSCQGKALMWVAELSGKEIVGQLFVQLSGSREELADGLYRAYVYGFRIKPQFQGAGLGTRLLQTVEEDLRNRDFEWITLNVGRGNFKARRFYHLRGYKIVAAEPGQWAYSDEQGRVHHVNEPAWRMVKHL